MTASPEKILIVEDETHLCSSLNMLFRLQGYKVEIANDGAAALEKIQEANRQKTPFKLMTLDIQMPHLNGLELIDKLKRQDIFFQTIIITGVCDKNLLIELLKRNCNKIFEKPFDEQELLGTVANILKKEKKIELINEIIYSENLANLIEAFQQEKTKVMRNHEVLESFFSNRIKANYPSLNPGFIQNIGIHKEMIKKLNEMDRLLSSIKKLQKQRKPIDDYIT